MSSITVEAPPAILIVRSDVAKELVDEFDKNGGSTIAGCRTIDQLREHAWKMVVARHCLSEIRQQAAFANERRLTINEVKSEAVHVLAVALRKELVEQLAIDYTYTGPSDLVRAIVRGEV